MDLYTSMTDNHAGISVVGRPKGFKVSEETKRKLSEAAKGEHRSPETEVKPGEHLSPETEFKTGERYLTSCAACSKELSLPAHRFKHTKLHFCDKGCHDVYQTGRRSEQKACAGCGSNFIIGGRGNRARKAVFCSIRCASRARIRTGETANELTVAQASYIAGLVDGEGSIMLIGRRGGCALRLTVSNNVYSVMEWLTSTLGVGVIVRRLPNNKKHATSYTYQINSHGANSIIQQIRPHMVIKARQADLAMEAYRGLNDPLKKSDRTWQTEAYEQMKQLNRRGPL